MKDTEPLSFTYDGWIHWVRLDDILAKPYPKNVTVKYTNLDGSVATPMNAGTYLVVVSYAGDDDWAPSLMTSKEREWLSIRRRWI